MTQHRTLSYTRAPRSRVPTVPRLVHRVRGCASSILLVSVAAACLGACASKRAWPKMLFVDQVDGDYAELIVASNYRQDVNVYLVRGASRTRLGEVDAFSTKVFRLPQYLPGTPRRVVLECQRSRSLHETREFSWQGGQRLSLAFGPLLNSARLNIPRLGPRVQLTKAPRTIAD